MESLNLFIKVLIGPYNACILDGGENEATDETIIILPFWHSIIDGRKIFVSAITEVPRTLMKSSSSSIGVS